MKDITRGFMEKPKPPANLWEKMDEARAQLPVRREPPEGSFSVQDYMKRYNLPRATSAEQVRNLLDKGLVEVAGSVGNQKFYRLVVQQEE
jgi:Fic family protein